MVVEYPDVEKISIGIFLFLKISSTLFLNFENKTI